MKRILLVDNEVDGTCIKEYFVRFQHIYQRAKNLEEASYYIKLERPDGIITDLYMPRGMDFVPREHSTGRVNSDFIDFNIKFIQ